MEPKNDGFQKESPNFQGLIFRFHASFRGCTRLRLMSFVKTIRRKDFVQRSWRPELLMFFLLLTFIVPVAGNLTWDVWWEKCWGFVYRYFTVWWYRLHVPCHPCMLYLPTFTIKNQPNVYVNTPYIHGWYGYKGNDTWYSSYLGGGFIFF